MTETTSLTPTQVVTNVSIVTTLAGNLTSSLNGLSTSTGASDVQSKAQAVTNDFQTMIASLSGSVVAMEGASPFDDAGAALVVNALRDFMPVHQALLATVIGKHPIFGQFGTTAPIAATLRSLEAGIDSFVFSMIDLLPSQKDEVVSLKDSLDHSLSSAVTTYERICIPSPLYPIILPVCA